MILAAALLFAAGQSSTITSDDQLPPAPQAAIVEGGKACIGATVDPDGEPARLAGWRAVTDAKAQNVGKENEGRVVSRDNVRLVVKPGIDGGCVVQAAADASFDKARFLADLSSAAGTTIDGTKPTVDLPNGELMVVQVGDDEGKTFVQLVIANPNGKYAKKYKGK